MSIKIDYPVLNEENWVERWIAEKFRRSLTLDKPYKCRDCGRKIYRHKFPRRHSEDVCLLKLKRINRLLKRKKIGEIKY